MKNTYGVMLKPYKIKNMNLKNRVVMSPMDFKFVYGNHCDATLTKRLEDVLKARAKGGVGLIITSHIKAEQTLDPFPKSLSFPVIDRDERIKEFAEIAEMVHLYDTKIAAELSPGSGRYADEIENEEILSASTVATQYHQDVLTRPMTKNEINYLVDCYGKAAGRLKQAGFDAICVHCSCGYLMEQFLSPAWNNRTDEYGGSLENRMRFMIECIESAKKYTGNDFPFLLSFTIDEKLNDVNLGTLTNGEKVNNKVTIPKLAEGIDVNYAVKIAKRLEKMGYVDAYHIRIGNYYNQEHIIPSSYSDNSEYTEAITKFKAGVTKPVIFDNKLNDPFEMEKLIENKKADMVSMGRGWIAEPEWVKKAMNNSKKIRPCIRCMMCLETTWMDHYCECGINPQFGHEAEQLLPVIDKKNIMVIGGGPGGMTAALVAAKRGHNVTLIEKSNHLGGRLLEAGASSYKSEVLKYSNWLIDEVKNASVKIILGLEADAEYIINKKNNAAIIATGGKTILPNITGGENTILAEDILLNKKTTGENIVVIGGGLIGCETAYKLWEEGKNVTIIEMQNNILLTTSIIYRHAVIKKINDTSIKLKLNTKVDHITTKGVFINNDYIECDNTIWAVGIKSDDQLYKKLYQYLDDVYVIGDAKHVGRIFNAVHEGYGIAAEI